MVPLIEFWQKHPALLYGLSFLIGVYAAIEFSWALLFIVALLWGPFLFLRAFLSAISAFILAFSAFFFTTWTAQHPRIPEYGVKGTALFNISELTYKDSIMGKRWNYRGKVMHFVPINQTEDVLYNVPAIISLPDTDNTNRPPANQAYTLEGRIKQSQNGKYILYPEKYQPWHPLKETWSPAEWRFHAKRAVNDYIIRKIQSEPSRSFLAGIATGDFENRLMSFELSRFGLQHIMAISGFHFAIIAGILSFFLSLVIGRKVALITLMIMMTLYFLFLGNAPSITRAWVSCMIAFAAFLFEKQPSGLNAIGLALLFILIIDPETAMHIGFQFSFIVTSAILLLYSPIDRWLQNVIPKRSLSVALEMNSANQHGFIVLALLRQSLALSIAINLAALPLTLYYFQKFPLMSILYNFFFPWMVSISMLLLLGGLLFDMLLPFMGNFLHSVNEYFTEFALDYTHALPRSIDIHLNLSIAQEVVILALGLLFTAGIYIQHHKKTEYSQ